MVVVAGEIDTIEILAGRNVHDVIEEIKTQAVAKAVAAGADPSSTRIVEVANIPVQVRCGPLLAFLALPPSFLCSSLRSPRAPRIRN